ncbi:MAG TPA: hypothetical protein VF533_07105 [Solirubrobacteraceae bacterium]
MATTGTQLRPLGIGEVLDAAFKVYRERFKTLALCVLVPTAPLAVLQVLILLSIDDSTFAPDSSSQADDAAGTALIAFGLTSLLSYLAFYAAAAACIRAVAGAYLDTEVTWQESVKLGLRRMLPVLGLSILLGLVTTLTLPIFLLGVFLFIRWSVTIPARVVEDAKWFSSIGRSWTLVGGRWWWTFLLVFILVVLLVVISIVIGIIFAIPAGLADSTIAGAAANLVGSLAVNVIVLPLGTAVITIHYFDLRVRKEGFDLQLLADSIGTPAPAGVAHGSGLGADAPASPQWETGGQSYGGFSAPRADEPEPRA